MRELFPNRKSVRPADRRRVLLRHVFPGRHFKVIAIDIPEIDRRSAHAPMAPGAIKRDAMPAQVVGKLQQAFRRGAERALRLVIDGLGDRVAGLGILLLGAFNDTVSDMLENVLGPANYAVTPG